MRLRPEITCTLIISDGDFYRECKKKFTGNWENAATTWNNLQSDNDLLQLITDRDTPLCPRAAAAIISGRKFALHHLKLPTIPG
jgi:hypothetical protein